MKLLLSTIFLLIAACVSFSQGPGETKKYRDTSEVPRITLEDAKKAYDDKSAIFIDARATEAYKIEHVKGAISFPLGSTNDYSGVPRGKTIIVYCS